MKEVNEKTPIFKDVIFKDAGDKNEIKGHHHLTGLSFPITIVFLLAGLLGVGVLALPYALASSGWAGIVFIFTSFVIATYNGINLGTCWNIVLERYPEYTTVHVQYPYALIGEKAVGKWMRYVVSVNLGITCFGGCVLFSILAAMNLHSMLMGTVAELSFCIWLAILYGLLIPLTWMKSPKDFWWLSFLAAGGAFIGCILMFASFIVSLATHTTPTNITHHYPTAPSPYFLAFGSVLFAYAGACGFPTVQHDMKQPSRFKYAVIVAYTVMLCSYIPISALGYYIYGDKTPANILQALPRGPLRISAEALFTIHVIFAIVIGVNPVLQDVEDRLSVPHNACNWKRLAFRTLFMGVALFVAESVPHFGALVALLGGSASTFNTFISPALFFLCLHRKREKKDTHKELSICTKAINISIIAIGILAGGVSTYAALEQLLGPATFLPPCYVNSTAAQGN